MASDSAKEVSKNPHRKRANSVWRKQKKRENGGKRTRRDKTGRRRSSGETHTKSKIYSKRQQTQPDTTTNGKEKQMTANRTTKIKTMMMNMNMKNNNYLN